MLRKVYRFHKPANICKICIRKIWLYGYKPLSTPVDVSAKVDNDEDSELVDKPLYQSAVGSLLYLSTKTRLDITFAVCNVTIDTIGVTMLLLVLLILEFYILNNVIQHVFDILIQIG